MFLQRKKGDMVVQFVILLVIAVILIFVVTAFGAKIWSSFFPSGDKSTVASFDAFYYILNMKAVSDLDYDMSPASIYLKKGYCMVLFDSEIVTEGNTIYYSPDECDKSQCICLYDGSPKEKERKKNKNKVKCLKLSEDIILDRTYYDMNPSLCSESGERYTSFLVIRRVLIKVGSEQYQPYIYIINDNTSNRQQSEKWTVNKCTDDAASLCYGKSDGNIIAPDDDAGITRVYDTCLKAQTSATEDEASTAGSSSSDATTAASQFKSTSVKCNYIAAKRTCQIDCSYGDVSNECGTTYKTCDDLNEIIGIDGVTNYLSTQSDYEYYYMCSNDAKFCNLGCEVARFEVYISNETVSPDGTLLYSVIDPEIIKNCDLKYTDELQGKYGRYLYYYDTDNQSCVDAMKQKYYPDRSTIMECKFGKDFACESFIKEKGSDCSLKYLNYNDKYWITYHDPKCDSNVNELFTATYLCQKKQAKPAST